MELRGVVLLLFPPPSFDSSWVLVGGNGLLVAWLALLRSIGARPTPTPSLSPPPCSVGSLCTVPWLPYPELLPSLVAQLARPAWSSWVGVLSSSPSSLSSLLFLAKLLRSSMFI